MIEKWKDIAGYEGFYLVSDMGRVKSLWGGRDAQSGKILKQTLHRAPYLKVILAKNGVHKNHSIHQLVAMAFLKNPSKKKEVNHLNGDPTDNRVVNLEWTTRKENADHAHAIGKYHHAPKCPVICVNNGLWFESQKEAARELKICPKKVNNCIRGTAMTADGYRFIKAEPQEVPSGLHR